MYIALSIPNNVTKQLINLDVPGIKEDSSGYHITMVYFGKEISLKEIGLPTIEAVYDFAATQKLLSIEAEEISSFPGNDDGVPIIIPIISNELKECRQNLVECLDKNKIEYDKKYPEYKPHLTLSYADSNEKFKSRKLQEKLSWMAHELVIKIGYPGPDRIEVKFPLGLNKESKTKFMSNLFRKIA